MQRLFNSIRIHFTPFLIALFLLLSGNSAIGQVTIDATYTPQQLAQTLIGPGVVMSNFSLNCDPTAIGYFSVANVNIGIQDGILMTTGNASLAPGPNTIPNAGSCTGGGGDPALNAMLNGNTYDACMLEYDIIPTCNSITITYLFASEEYPEFVNRGFNDVFAFFISGPGVPLQNIALVPGTALPVSINTINTTSNSALYVNNTPGPILQYDGFTRPLTATVAVTPCQTYHIKLTIADGADCIFDSGVFIASNSIQCSGGAPSSVVSATIVEPTAIEGCKSAEISFCRTGSTAQAQVVPLTFSGTATAGTDYNVPASVTIPAGSQCATFSIPAMPDNQIEGVETVEIDFLAFSTGSCPVNSSVSVNIKDEQRINLSFISNNVCIGNTMNFFNTSTVSGSGSVQTYTWDFGDGTPTSTAQNPTHIYNTAGTFNVTLSAVTFDGCTNSLVIPVGVFDAPAPSFTVGNLCVGAPVTFTNNTTPPSTGTIASYVWDFGDGSFSSVATPSHNYGTAGNFNVTLTATSSNQSCSATFQGSVNVYAGVNADFTTQDVCLGTPVGFVNTTTGPATSYLWNFGDGGPTLTLQNPTRNYTAPQVYNVTLTATTADGCSHTRTKTVGVYDAPVSSFTVANVCESEFATFQNNSVSPVLGNIAGYVWDFGNGSTYSGVSPVHLYSAPGNYTVNLRVYSSFLGCSHSSTRNLTIYPEPVADFTFQDVCLHDVAQFTDISTGNPVSWEWDFGDGSPVSTVQNPTHLYTSAGSFYVKLTVKNSDACESFRVYNLVVHSLPVAQFFGHNVCMGNPINFQNTSTVAFPENIVSWVWDFNDGTAPLSSQVPSYVYQIPGNFNVNLLVSTAFGCTGTVTNPVIVYDPPTSAFTFNDVCQNVAAQFNFTSQNPTIGTISSWIWSFGDGSSSSAQNPAHSYSTPGVYTVSLITYSSNLSCPDTVLQDINVLDIPYPDYSFANICHRENTAFTDLSAGNITSYSWNFDDSTPNGNGANPTHIYQNTGNYNVRLTAQQANGCLNSISKIVIIHPLPTAAFLAQQVCHNSPTSFQNASSVAFPDNLVAWRWNYGDASPLVNIHSPSYIYPLPGTFNAQLHVTTNFGCMDSTTLPVTVNPNPVVDFTASDVEGCSPFCITFQDMSTIVTGSNQQWLWNFGNFKTSSNRNPDNCFGNSSLFDPLDYNVQLRVTSDKGCQTTLLKPDFIRVLPKPVAAYLYDPIQNYIFYPVVRFKDISSGSTGWDWDFGEFPGAPHSTLQFPVYEYSDTGRYIVTQMVNNDFGCMDTISHEIRVEPDYAFYIPNSFSPNNLDNINDVFLPTGYGILEFRMEIFNKWGGKVFLSEDKTKGWDGTVRDTGSPAKEDTYFYKINVKNLRFEWNEYHGYLILVR